MVNSIFKKIHVFIPQEQAFEYFVDEISQWWPKEYTWSQQKLDIQSPELIKILWQISSDRVPEPNQDKCSQISISFRSFNKMKLK